MATDEIARIEVEAIRRTAVSDWHGARAFFEQALEFDMPALRRAEILRNVAGTYWKEGNSQMANITAQNAIEVLNSEGTGGIKAESLRSELHNISTFTGGKLPVSTFWYAVVFIAGLYWGLSVASGAPMDRWLVLVAPPIMCFATACFAIGSLNSRVWLGTITLYVNFLFSFGVGYSVATSGLIRFAGY